MHVFWTYLYARQGTWTIICPRLTPECQCGLVAQHTRQSFVVLYKNTYYTNIKIFCGIWMQYKCSMHFFSISLSLSRFIILCRDIARSHVHQVHKCYAVAGVLCMSLQWHCKWVCMCFSRSLQLLFGISSNLNNASVPRTVNVIRIKPETKQSQHSWCTIPLQLRIYISVASVLKLCLHSLASAIPHTTCVYDSECEFRWNNYGETKLRRGTQANYHTNLCENIDLACELANQATFNKT